MLLNSYMCKFCFSSEKEEFNVIFEIPKNKSPGVKQKVCIAEHENCVYIFGRMKATEQAVHLCFH